MKGFRAMQRSVRCYCQVLPSLNEINVEEIQVPGMRNILLSNVIAFFINNLFAKWGRQI
jgi:hypothetical protein